MGLVHFFGCPTVSMWLHWCAWHQATARLGQVEDCDGKGRCLFPCSLCVEELLCNGGKTPLAQCTRAAAVSAMQSKAQSICGTGSSVFILSAAFGLCMVQARVVFP